MSKLITVSLIVTLSAILTCHADEGRDKQDLSNPRVFGWSSGKKAAGTSFKLAGRVESAADRLYSHSFGVTSQSSNAAEADSQFCASDNTGVITIYTTNGMAKKEIDVTLDGKPIGSLTTYFPDGGPGCRTPSARGVITINIPAGKHVLEADSPNLSWPGHTFSVEKCECMLLPLS